MVGGGVDKNTTLIPRARFDTDVFMDGAEILQLAVADGDHCKEKDK